MQPKMFNNKKAQLFELLLVVMTVIVCGDALYASMSHADTSKLELTAPASLRQIYIDGENLKYYLEDYSKISAQNAFAEIAKKPVYGTGCGEWEYAIWDTKCPDNNVIKDKFIEKIKALQKEYPADITYDDDKIKFKYSPIVLEKTETDFSAKYTINLEFEISYPDLNFRKIADDILNQKKLCDDEFKNNADKIEKINNCLSELIFDDWNDEVSISGSYYLFTLTSAKNYFYENDFKPITLKFLIKQ